VARWLSFPAYDDDEYTVTRHTRLRNGPGVDTFDALSALERWVEHGVAPDKIIGSHTGSGIGPNIMTGPSGNFTRPLCPYPETSHYRGAGNPSDAASFTCQADVDGDNC